MKCQWILWIVPCLYGMGAQENLSDSTQRLLQVIPADSWGFVAVSNLESLDEKLAELFERLGMPPIRLRVLLETRIHLGPPIDPDGAFAVVFMPAGQMDRLGASAVLVFPCPDVPGLLSDFETQELSPKLWQAELVWGPTYVGQADGFAVLGSNVEATKSVLDARSMVREVIPESIYFANLDIFYWLNLERIMGSDAYTEWLVGRSGPEETTSMWGGDSLLLFDWHALRQVRFVHGGVRIDPHRIQCDLTLSAKPDSALDKLCVSRDVQVPRKAVPLPELSYVFLAEGHASADQMRAKAQELDKLFASKTIADATHPELLGTFRGSVQQMMCDVRGGAWGIAAIPESSAGLVAPLMCLQVEDADRWMTSLRNCIDLASGPLFVDPDQSHQFFKEIRYVSAADTISGLPVDHVVVQMNSSEVSQTEGLNLRAAWGGSTQKFQLARMGEHTILIAGGRPYEMNALIQAARGEGKLFYDALPLRQLEPLLDGSRQATLYFSLPSLLRVGRSLGRLQNQVEQIPHYLNKDIPPVAATLKADAGSLQIHVVLLTEFIQGIKSMLTGEIDLERQGNSEGASGEVQSTD